MSEHPNLSGKIALVTGASRGIGRAIAQRLASAGATVVVTARSVDKEAAGKRFQGEQVVAGTLKETVLLIESAGGRAIAIGADLESLEQCQGLVARAVEAAGGLDILINNAGFADYARVESMSLETFDRTFQHYLRAPFLLARAAIPEMKARGAGWIVNIGSVTSMPVQRPFPDYQRAGGDTVYASIKAALNRFTQGLAAELVDSNIAVNLVGPSTAIRTPGASDLIPTEYPTEDVEYLAETVLAMSYLPASERTGLLGFSMHFPWVHDLQVMSLDGKTQFRRKSRRRGHIQLFQPAVFEAEMADLMQALIIDRFGGPEVLHIGEIPRPIPGPGEVLVEVAYASVNPADWKTREGMLSKYIDYKFPFVLGFDLAGVVRDVGTGVTQWRARDCVFGTSKQGQGQNGSYAEFTIANAAMLARLPANVTMAEAAGLPTAGITAYGGLIDVGNLKPGQSVLINGGAGGVGSLGIQIAKAVGANVAVTCSVKNFGYVREIGADLAIDYRKGEVDRAVRAWAPEGVDLVLDAVGLGTLLPQATALVRPGGSFVEIETLISAASQEQMAAAAAKNVRIVSNMISVARLHEHLSGLAAMVVDGLVRPPPTEIVPLDEAAQAHARVKDGHVRGKIALRVAAGLDGVAR